jgi:hypothetical protein
MCRVIITACATCDGYGQIAVPTGNMKCETCNGEGWLLDVT